MITANEKRLLLRFSDYKSHSFIDEHQNLINEIGEVWMLKMGRRIPNDRLAELFSNGGQLLLKASKHSGGRYYCASVIAARNGTPTAAMIYPQYYSEMLKDENLFCNRSLEGTWFCVENISELPLSIVEKLRLVSNDKMVEDVLGQTRSSVVYVYYKTH